jgi:glycosyltransferase involved in cell wall biosynthesis
LSLISVVITTYNRPDHLENAIKTVQNQTVGDLEILVVDGMNSDTNRNVVKKADDQRIKYIGIEHDTGVHHARTLGCQKAKGKYIAMLDDDDIWTPNKLEKQLKEFNDENVALTGSYTKVFLDDGSFIIEKFKSQPTYKDLLVRFDISQTSALMFRNDVIKKVGYFNEKLRGMTEHDIALKVAKNGYKIINISEPLLIRHPQEKGKSLERSYYHKIAETLDFWHYYGKEFIPNIGYRGFMFNAFKTVGLLGIFSLGYLIGDRIWTIIRPLNSFYQQRGLQ